MSRLRTWLLLASAVLLLLPATPAAAVPHPPPTGISTLGNYWLNSHYNGDITATRGWEITWRIPTVSNTSVAWGAVGQWYYNLESGVYHTPGDGWMVYYFDDDNGVTENNSACNLVWTTGGTCGGVMGDLPAGQELTFIYEWCDENRDASVTGGEICLYVDLKDGAGRRFLAADVRDTVEMYAHDIETFSDSGPAYVEPEISCSTPTEMLGQRIMNSSGIWSVATGNQWTFQDNSPDYEFQNINTSSTPATWESCSTPPPVCTDPAWNDTSVYNYNDVVSHNGRRWRAQWWTQNQEPGTTGQYGVWEDLGSC